MTALLLVQYTFVMNNRTMMVLQREVGLKFFIKLESYISQLHSFKTEGSVNITNVSFRNLRFLISSSCYKQTYEGLFFKKSDFLYAQSTERINNLRRWIFFVFINDSYFASSVYKFHSCITLLSLTNLDKLYILSFSIYLGNFMLKVRFSVYFTLPRRFIYCTCTRRMNNKPKLTFGKCLPNFVREQQVRHSAARNKGPRIARSIRASNDWRLHSGTYKRSKEKWRSFVSLCSRER